MNSNKLIAGKIILAAVLFVIFGTAHSRSSRADDKVTVTSVLDDIQKEKAKTRFMAGVDLFFNEDYPGALAAFQDSYRVFPKYSVLYNIAMCQKALYKYVESIANFEKFLGDGGAEIKPKKRKKVQSALAEMRRLIGKVAILDAPTGLNVMIDGEVVATAPLTEPIPLDPGKHLVQLVKEGYKPQITMINVASGSQTTIRTALLAIDSRIKIDCKDDKAIIYIDGRQVGHCPYQGKISPGPHKIVISAPGKKAYSRQVETGPGATSTISVTLEVPEPATVVDTQEADREPKATQETRKATPMLITGIVSLVVGAGMGAMGGVFHSKASSDYNEAQDILDETEAALNDPNHEDYRNEEYLNELAADYNDIVDNKLPVDNALMIVGYVSAGVFLATGVVLLVVDAKKKKRAVASRVTPTLGGVSVRF